MASRTSKTEEFVKVPLFSIQKAPKETDGFINKVFSQKTLISASVSRFWRPRMSNKVDGAICDFFFFLNETK